MRGERTGRYFSHMWKHSSTTCWWHCKTLPRLIPFSKKSELYVVITIISDQSAFSRWLATQILFMFTPKIVDSWSNLTIWPIFVQMGWFNLKLEPSSDIPNKWYTHHFSLPKTFKTTKKPVVLLGPSPKVQQIRIGWSDLASDLGAQGDLCVSWLHPLVVCLPKTKDYGGTVNCWLFVYSRIYTYIHIDRFLFVDIVYRYSYALHLGNPRILYVWCVFFFYELRRQSVRAPPEGEGWSAPCEHSDSKFQMQLWYKWQGAPLAFAEASFETKKVTFWWAVIGHCQRIDSNLYE